MQVEVSMKIKTINIKEDYPPADVAVAYFEMELEALVGLDTLALKVVHGYGSHGKGGEIKKQLHQRLCVLKKFGKIRDFIPGEKLGYFARQDKYLQNYLSDLFVDPDLKNYNNGITIVLINSDVEK